MIVQPGLVDDPKYLTLRLAVKALSSRMNAAEVLLRLWGHCQQNQRGEFWQGGNSKYVEAVCRYEKQDGRLFAMLTEQGWVDLENDGVRIHDWVSNNKTLVQAWTEGKKGGRPAKQPPGIRQDNPLVNPPDTGGLTDGEMERKKEGGSAPPAIRSADFPEAEWPDENAVLTECGLRGIPPALGCKFWTHYESKSPKWGGVGNWRQKLRGWWLREQSGDVPGKKQAATNGPAAVELLDIDAELQWQTDEIKIAALKKRRGLLGGN